MKKLSTVKKGSIFTAAMVLLLGGAIYLNVRYSSALTDKNTKYMGDTVYVDSTENNAVAVNGSVDGDYIENAKAEREKSYEEAEELLTDILKTAQTSEEEKQEALKKSAELSKRKTDENAIETLLLAKGFEKTAAVIGDNGISVIVNKPSLTAAETAQIEDAVISQCNTEMSKIKIITVD